MTVLLAFGLWLGLSEAIFAQAHDAHALPPFAGSSVGTSRQPLSVPAEGRHLQWGSWSLMFHGDAAVGRRWEPSPRGEDDLFFTNMLMGSARRPVGAGWMELTARASLEPAMGPAGYSLLLQTGESADGVVPLVDRQHPHDALVEFSGSFRTEIDQGAWAFLYLAPVGSPALGPTPYMHRPSGAINPTTPISHHFMDATHITHGVLTGGVFDDRFQAEVSWFNGLESDTRRWRPEVPRLDSWSVRLILFPRASWVAQASYGRLHEPERLHPGVDLNRASVSLTHHAAWGRDLSTSTTLAWGQNSRPRTTMSIGEARVRLSPPLLEHYLGTAQLPPDADDTLLLLFPKRVLSAVLVEATVRWRAAALFTRYERARKDELFAPPDARHSTVYGVAKLDVGAALELATPTGVRGAIGVGLSRHLLPGGLAGAYGENPASYLVFTRIGL